MTAIATKQTIPTPTDKQKALADAAAGAVLGAAQAIGYIPRIPEVYRQAISGEAAVTMALQEHGLDSSQYRGAVAGANRLAIEIEEKVAKLRDFLEGQANTLGISILQRLDDAHL